jgi:cell division protease FtsH
MAEKKRKMSEGTRSIIIWVIIFLPLIIYYLFFLPNKSVSKQLTYSEFLRIVKAGQVKSVIMKSEIGGSEIKVIDVNNREYKLHAPEDPDLIKLLTQNNVEIIAKPLEQNQFLMILANWAPFILLIIIWILMAKQIQGTTSSPFTFGKSRAKMFLPHKQEVTFNDVAGVEEAKEELKEVIEFLKNPQKFQKLGGKVPKGILLLGPPGTGKTLLAKAVAGEAGVPFFSISGSDFVELFVGVGASRVRDLFEQGKKHAPSILFIDELDAVGRHRGAGLGGGHDEREQTLNQLLVEMDGFDSNKGIVVIAATNRPDILDPALLRPGRFDRTIVIDNPDLAGREGILKVHTRKVPLDSDVDLKVIARATVGFSGADLANLVNEAALLAARKNKKAVSMEDFEEAKDKVMMGPERKSRIISERDKKITAYHESGHALVNKLLPNSEPLHKITIIPRGRALGVTSRLPLEDKYTRGKQEFLSDITILLGGRAAEELFLNEITTGASNDLETATEIAYKMVCQYGMSENLPLRTFGKREQEIFIGRDWLKEKNYSEDTARKIDNEVERIIESCYKKAKTILLENKDKFFKLVNALLEKEILDNAEVERIIST